MTTMIGLHGKAGAGKDTVYERLLSLGGPKYVRRSIADPMKDSIAALFGVSLERLEELKRDPSSFVKIGGTGEPSKQTPGAYMARYDRSMTVRQFMQRYGTEAHRGVFGQDFWLDFWMRQWADTSAQGEVWVNTSVRFENEAQRIRDVGGEVWLIKGPHDGVEGHESEVQLPDRLIDRVIDNTERASFSFAENCGDPIVDYPDFSHLDSQVAAFLTELEASFITERDDDDPTSVGSPDETNPDRPHRNSNPDPRLARAGRELRERFPRT